MLSFLRSVADELSMWYYKVNCDFEFSATSEEIAAGLADALVEGDATAVQEALLSPVDEIIASDSYQTDVFSGGDTTKFEENVETVTTAIVDTANTVIQNLPALTEAATIADIQSKFDGILELLSLLGSAARGDNELIGAR